MGKSEVTLEKHNILSVGQQGPEFNGYLVGRGNSREIDLNRNFPDLNALMYYYEKTNGRNHHLPLPDNWEQQVSATGGPIYLYVWKYMHLPAWVWQRAGERKMDEYISHARVTVRSMFEYVGE